MNILIKLRASGDYIYKSKWARAYSQTTNPGLSIKKTILVRLRILLEFFFRSSIDFWALRQAHRSARSVRGSKRGRNAIVIANGPSVNKLDPAKLAEAKTLGSLDIFAVNWFATSELAKFIEPDFYVLSDPDTGVNSEHLNSSSLWSQLSQWKSVTLVLPHNWLKLFRSQTNFDAIFFDDRELIGWSKNLDLHRPRGFMSMTAFKALAAALYFDYDNIFVIGFDNSMYLNVSVNLDNELGQTPLHFYRESTEKVEKLENWYPGGMSDYLYDHARCFSDLRYIFSDSRITNLDPASLTDAFKKSRNGFLIKEVTT